MNLNSIQYLEELLDLNESLTHQAVKQNDLKRICELAQHRQLVKSLLIKALKLELKKVS